VGNTVIIAVSAALLSTLIGTLGAIGVFESKPWFKKTLEFSTQIPVVNPEIVIALSLIVMFVFIGSMTGYFRLSYWTFFAGHLGPLHAVRLSFGQTEAHSDGSRPL
jgi:spermidine/putrescine transport system permease protein